MVTSEQDGQSPVLELLVREKPVKGVNKRISDSSTCYEGNCDVINDLER